MHPARACFYVIVILMKSLVCNLSVTPPPRFTAFVRRQLYAFPVPVVLDAIKPKVKPCVSLNSGHIFASRIAPASSIRLLESERLWL